MTLDLSEQPLYGYVLSNNNGKVMLVDVNITAPSASGSLAFDAGGFDNYAGADVTLTGNSEINGNVGYGVTNSNITGARLTIENGTINGRIIKSDTYETSVKVSGGTFAEPVEARFWRRDWNTKSTLMRGTSIIVMLLPRLLRLEQIT